MDFTPSSATVNWTPRDLGDLSGTTAVVTGGSIGIGQAVTAFLVRHGVRVLIGARDIVRAEASAQRLSEHARRGGTVEAASLDLADPASIRDFAVWVSRRSDQLDLLVNNAGISNQEFRLTVSGAEQQFAVNHLGHYALTGHLLPLMSAHAAGARVVTVTSTLYSQAMLDLTLLADKASYHPGVAYLRSKLANVLFATELDRRLRRSGSRVRSTVAHPGLARTPMHDSYPSEQTTHMVKSALAQMGRDPEDAITGILYAATSPHARPHLLYGPGGDTTTPQHVTADPLQGPADDLELAGALWKISSALANVSYLEKS